MAIPEQQLTTWSNIGAIVSSTTTYNSVKAAIDGINWLDIVKYDLYLQGSYRNSTNIVGEQLELFGDSKEQWNLNDAETFIKSIIGLYNNR